MTFYCLCSVPISSKSIKSSVRFQTGLAKNSFEHIRSCFEFIAQSTHENGYIKPRKTFWRNSKQLLNITPIGVLQSDVHSHRTKRGKHCRQPVFRVCPRYERDRSNTWNLHCPKCMSATCQSGYVENEDILRLPMQYIFVGSCSIY